MTKKNKKRTAYHTFNKPSYQTSWARKRRGVIIFWLLFVVLMACLFMVYRNRIRKTVQESHLPAWFSKPQAEQQVSGEHNTPVPIPDEGPASVLVAPLPDEEAPEDWSTVGPDDGLDHSESRLAAVPESPETIPDVSNPAGSLSPAFPESPSPMELTETVRALYFIQVDQNGDIQQIRVTRKFPASNSPLLDVLKELLQGPTVEEQGRGLISLIPQGTGILSVIIRGETAYISFSDDFKYNTFGAEGYTAQLKQILWTVQEFPHLKDVQILIDGRVVDFLSEGIPIGRPINRDMYR
ncbi:MAG: GerMN domain-containing protein [Treponema sp.]|jgi:hypothetical protein|nr:GerMN domain-containing protein [Treponema sp.]